MQFITKKQDLVDNATVIEKYLTGKDATQKKFAEDLIINSPGLSVYKVNGENHFAPNHFCAYKNNNMADYLKNEGKETKDSNPVVTKIIGAPFFNDKIEEKFQEYAKSIGIKPADHKRNYWRVKDERGKNLDLKL